MKKLTILLFTASILFAGNLENFLKNDSQELEINKRKDIKEKTIKKPKTKKIEKYKNNTLEKIKESISISGSAVYRYEDSN
jgi:hypothetical protein